MTNPFISVFSDTVDWDDPFGEKVDNQLSTEEYERVARNFVVLQPEEYEHLLLRVATAEQKYWEIKQLLEVK